MMLGPPGTREGPHLTCFPDPPERPLIGSVTQLPTWAGVEAIRDSVHPPRLMLLIPTDPMLSLSKTPGSALRGERLSTILVGVLC